jgi:hypothetical protein
MMILKIARQYAAQVMLVGDDNMIQTFTANRTDETTSSRDILLAVDLRDYGR